MLNLRDIYKSVKPAVVAIVSRLSYDPTFPMIIGTGYIVREDGIIFTNRHVIEACEKLPKTKDNPEEKFPALALLFHADATLGVKLIPMEIVSIAFPQKTGDGPRDAHSAADVAIIQVDVTGLPTVKIAKDFTLCEGDQVATCGFPMGTDVLAAPGWLYQVTPVLQQGIISAILPMPCNNPHSILVDIQIEGGASGSPIFDPTTGEVVAMLYASLEANQKANDQNGKSIRFPQNTSHTLAVPSKFLNEMLGKLTTMKGFQDHKINHKKLEELLKEVTEIIHPGEPMLKHTCDIESI